MKTLPPLLLLGLLALSARAAELDDQLPPASHGKSLKLIWHGEFDGDRLDQSKWEPRPDGKRKGGWWGAEAISLDSVGHLKPQAVRLIFDTDMMGDVDDVGTAAVLHALADQGEVEILAMGLSGKNPWSPLCLDALSTYYRRSKIPIGVVKGPAFDRKSRYAETIAKEFPHSLKSAEDAPDAAVLYRKILGGEADKSVVMVSVGQVTNFRNLLKTGPDEHSDLPGVDLVKRKVRAWICMGGKIPEGREANLIHDGPAAAYAIANWPTQIVFSGWEIGQEIMTGAGLRKAPEGTPVRRAYELYNGLNNRQSWDQTAVLYAVRGLDGGLADYWELRTEGHLHVNQDGSNQWRSSPDKDHAYLARKMDPKKIAAVIEELMLRKPGFKSSKRSNQEQTIQAIWSEDQRQ